MVGYKTKEKKYPRLTPERPHGNQNRSEVSFREQATHDVVNPDPEYDPFADAHFASVEEAEDKHNEDVRDESDEPRTAAPNDPPWIRISDLRRVLPPGTRQRLLHTDADVSNEAPFARIEYATVTGNFDPAGSTTPGQVEYMSSDPYTFDEAIKDGASGGNASMMRKWKSSEDHSIFYWEDVATDTNVQLLSSEFLHR